MALAAHRPRARRVRRARTPRRPATLALAIVGAQLLVAVFLVPSIETQRFAALHLAPALPAAGALVAWGLRHQPRIGWLLGAITLAISAWVLLR